MTTKLILRILFVVLGSSAVAEQTNNSMTVTNWGDAVDGVQLSIRATTNIIIAGSPVILSAIIRNSSTNIVFIYESDRPHRDCHVSLIDNTGKTSDMTPEEPKHPVTLVFRNVFLDITPGTMRQREIPITLGKTFAPGNYKFEVTRDFHVPGGTNSSRLVSNLLEVQVK